MNKIFIKPLSVNSAYRGRRFSTPELKAYKESLIYMLPKMIVPKGKLKVWYTFGLSSKGGDYDNLVKCFQDVLSSVYGFNDNRIYQATIKKVDVKKGQEYIEFDIQKNED